MLTYDHSVKVNGKWYKAGEPIDLPVLTPAKVVQAVDNDAKPKVEEKPVETDVEKPVQRQQATTTKRSYTKRK